MDPPHDDPPADETPRKPDWPRLLERFGRIVYAVPRRRGLGAADCDDVYQATWLTAVSRPSPPPAEDETAFVRWLAAIAAWETRNLLRRRRPGTSDAAACEAVADAADGEPDRLEEAVEEHRIVEAALAALPPRDRSLLIDLFLTEEPLSYHEVAQRLGVAPGSVGPLRLRAIERLRAELVRRGLGVPEGS